MQQGRYDTPSSASRRRTGSPRKRHQLQHDGTLLSATGSSTRRWPSSTRPSISYRSSPTRATTVARPIWRWASTTWPRSTSWRCSVIPPTPCQTGSIQPRSDLSRARPTRGGRRELPQIDRTAQSGLQRISAVGIARSAPGRAGTLRCPARGSAAQFPRGHRGLSRARKSTAPPGTGRGGTALSGTGDSGRPELRFRDLGQKSTGRELNRGAQCLSITS